MMNSDEEVDVDAQYSISDIKACHYSNKMFYILANKCQKIRGVYLLAIDETNLNESSKKNFIIKWKNQIEIGDGDIYVMHGLDRQVSF